MQAHLHNNLEYFSKRSVSKSFLRQGTLGFIALVLFIGCNIPPPEIGMGEELQLSEQKQAAMAFALGTIDNILGGDTQAYMEAHANEIRMVGDPEVYEQSALMPSVVTIRELPAVVDGQSQGVVDYFQNYEPRLLRWSEFHHECEPGQIEGWEPDENAYVFVGNNLKSEERLPADHLLNFVLGEHDGQWQIIGLLPE
jgi:hypothetical protein